MRIPKVKIAWKKKDSGQLKYYTKIKAYEKIVFYLPKTQTEYALWKRDLRRNEFLSILIEN